MGAGWGPSTDIEQERGMVRFAFCRRESWDFQGRGRLETEGGNTGSSPWRGGGLKPGLGGEAWGWGEGDGRAEAQEVS